MLSSLLNPYPEFNTELARCNAQTLVTKAKELNKLNDFAPFWLFLVFWSNCHGRRLSERGGWYKLKKRIWDWASVRSFTVKCSLHFHELLIVLSTGFDSEFRQDVFTQEDYHYLNLPWLVQDIQCLRQPCLQSLRSCVMKFIKIQTKRTATKLGENLNNCSKSLIEEGTNETANTKESAESES